MTSSFTRRLPTLFIPHGGGPWPFIAAPPAIAEAWNDVSGYLHGLSEAIGERPKAVLVISAHWDEPAAPTVNTGEQPPLLFDYYGFPEHTYRLQYPAPGAPDLAHRVRALLSAAGIASEEDGARGFDHGVFIPFMLIYPDADVPILTLSLERSLDPARHLAIGRALEPLREEGVLIVGSGMSYHNMRLFRSGEAAHVAAATRFDDWATETIAQTDISARDRDLARWAQHPDAAAAHFPTREHFVPLFVAAGAGGADQGRRSFSTRLLGKPLSGYQFG